VSTTVGTRQLVRLIIRRDRWVLPVSVLLPAVIVGTTAVAFADLYPTPESREQFAGLMATNPGITAFLGPIHGSSIGALTFWRTVIIGVVLAGLIPLFTVIRHTRAEEQAGRRELLGSTVVGRHAPLAAAAVVTCSVSVLLGAGVAVALASAGLDAVGALAAGTAWTGFALLSTAIGALTAQMVENPRTARGLGGGVLAVAYLLRIVGDTGGGALAWLSWLSPVGWMHSMRPFADEQWGILALFLGGAVAVGWVAVAMSARRDLGAGVFATRLGPPEADGSLASAPALARRLHRGSFVGWTVGIGAYAVIVGGLGPSMADILEDNPQLKEIFDRLGGEGAFIDVFLAAGLGFIALMAAAYAVQAALRIRGEEQDGHAELVLSTPVTRTRFFASHAVIVAAAPAAAMVIGGLIAGATYGVVTGDVAGQVPRLAAASAAHVPSLLILGGITLALFGALPRAAAAAWAVLVTFLVMGQLGPIIGLDQWVMNLSPFTHTPAMPAGRFDAEPIAWLTLTAVVLGAFALAAFRRRDAGTA
jgi:ABC-2 type transport system permease protein